MSETNEEYIPKLAKFALGGHTGPWSYPPPDPNNADACARHDQMVRLCDELRSGRPEDDSRRQANKMIWDLMEKDILADGEGE